jgi:arylformamidase
MAKLPDQERDAAWHELQYNPRVTVANVGDLLAELPRRAALTRATRPFLADIKTGPHRREVLDLYRVKDAKGTLVFMHGGYWRAFSKLETSWVAEGFLDQGYSVALLNYPLCPEVTLAALIDSVKRSFAVLHKEVLTEAERAAIVVCGHSAGAYLAAAFVATDWTSHGLPAQPFHGAVPISGIFELAPLLQTSMNEAIRLDAASAAELTLTTARARLNVPITFVVGGDESDEFHRQSTAMAAAWAALDPTVVDIPLANHFSVLDGLARPGDRLNAIAVDLLIAARHPSPNREART